MLRNLIIGLGLIVAVTLTGCSVEPSKIDAKHAQKMSKNLTYFRDHRTGLCFAIVTSRKTMNTAQTGLGLTNVPCANLKNVPILKMR